MDIILFGKPLPLSNLQPGFLDGSSHLILIEDRSCPPNTEIPSARSGQRTRAASNSTRDCVNLPGPGLASTIQDGRGARCRTVGSFGREDLLYCINTRGVSLRSCGLWRKLVLSRPSRCRFGAAAGSYFAKGDLRAFQVPSSQNVPHDPSAPGPSRLGSRPRLTLDIPRSGSEPLLRWTRSPVSGLPCFR